MSTILSFRTWRGKIVKKVVCLAMDSYGGDSTWQRAVAGRVHGRWARYRTRYCSISACGRPFASLKTGPWGTLLQHMCIDPKRPSYLITHCQ